MITDDQLPELSDFRKAEKKFHVREDFDFSSLVVPGDNSGMPVHRWFRFKESFSADLLKEILEVIPDDLGKRIRLLDPFCGVATSLISSQEMSSLGYDIEAVGIERNPFVAFAARSKVSWPRIEEDKLVDLGRICHKRSLKFQANIPPLSSLTRGRCISRYMSARVLAMVDSIRDQRRSPTFDALLLGVAASIESVSYVRKDGRALRIVEKERSQFKTVLEEIWQTMATDVALFKRCLPKARVPNIIVGDGRRPLQCGIKPDSIDLVITSPPYPNNIDYSEVYKLELWLLRLVDSPDQFLKLRRSTFRSHPTCSASDRVPAFDHARRTGYLRCVLDPIIERAESIGEPWRKKVLLGYFSDMWVALEQQYQCLKKGGYAVTVVGNSLHGSKAPYLIPSDIATACIAERLGFSVCDVIISRPLKRRLSGNHFLRESVVILRKPS